MRLTTYQHREAFCLMKYASKDGLIVEWIWNSRDGVTPFIIRAADGLTELQHVDWQLDRALPNYRPLPGERIFVDSTIARMRPLVVAYVDRNWDDPKLEMAAQFGTRDKAITALLGYWHQPGAPMVMTAAEAAWGSPSPSAAPDEPPAAP